MAIGHQQPRTGPPLRGPAAGTAAGSATAPGSGGDALRGAAGPTTHRPDRTCGRRDEKPRQGGAGGGDQRRPAGRLRDEPRGTRTLADLNAAASSKAHLPPACRRLRSRRRRRDRAHGCAAGSRGKRPSGRGPVVPRGVGCCHLSRPPSLGVEPGRERQCLGCADAPRRVRRPRRPSGPPRRRRLGPPASPDGSDGARSSATPIPVGRRQGNLPRA